MLFICSSTASLWMTIPLGFSRIQKRRGSHIPILNPWESTQRCGKPTIGQQEEGWKRSIGARHLSTPTTKTSTLKDALSSGLQVAHLTLIIGGKVPTYQQLSPLQAQKYRWVQMNHLIYDYCTDKPRYPVTPPECMNGVLNYLMYVNPSLQK